MKRIANIVAAGCLLVAAAMAQPPSYKVTDLGNVGPNGQPFTITQTGAAVGSSQTGSTLQAIAWHRGRTVNLGTPGLKGQNSQAFGVNQWGRIVGEAQTTTPDPEGEDFCGFKALGLESSGTTCLPFRWQNGVMIALPLLGGNNGSASQVNDRGAAVGTAENDTLDTTCPSGSSQKLQFKPVLWREGTVQELPTYPGDTDGNAYAINDQGQVAGDSGECAAFNPIWQTNLQSLHALLWENGHAIDLGNLGGTGHGNGIQAVNLNNAGQVVGFSDIEGNAAFHAFLWTRETGMQDLGAVGDDVSSAAIGINDAGQVVGVSLDANFNPRAFLRHQGQLLDLNTLIPASSSLFLATACSINDAGEITGIAFDKTGDVHAYVAVPVRGGNR
jgi:probable HAF family extracellular repeat protein